jgi:hypothetical protein
MRKSSAAHARFSLTAEATSLGIRAALDLRMIEQTFAERVSADHWLHAEANVAFDRSAGRTTIRLDHTEAGDGAIAAEAVVEVSDAGDAMVRSAAGDVDLARLLGWLPEGLVPVTAEQARLRYRVSSLVVRPAVRLSEGGGVEADASVANAAIRTLDGPIQIGSGELSLRAQPMPGGTPQGLATHAAVKLGGLSLATGQDRFTAQDLALEFDGSRGSGGDVEGTGAVRFARIERQGAPVQHGIAAAVIAEDGRAELRAAGLNFGAAGLPSARGDLALSFEAASVDSRSAGAHAMVDGLTLRAHAALQGHPPYAAEIEGAASRLRLLGPDGHGLVDAPARLEVRAENVQPDAANAAASRGVFHISAALGEFRASLDATKDAGAVDFALHAASPSLRRVRPLLPSALSEKAPWDEMTFELQSKGRVNRIAGGAPTVRQTTEVTIDRPAFGDLAARVLSLTLRSQGSALKGEADVDLHAQGLALGDGSASDDHLTLSVTADRERPSLQFKLATEGRAVAQLSGSLSFDAKRRAVPYSIEGHLAGLAPLAPLAAKVEGAAPLDLSRLEVTLSARGALLGAVAGVERDGSIKLEPSLPNTAAIEGKADVRVAHLRWAKADTAVSAPAVEWHGDMHAAGSRRTLDSRLDVGALQLGLGSREIDLSGIRDETTAAVSGNLADPEIELHQRLSIRGVEQTAVPEYPLGDLALALSAVRSREGAIHISEMKVTNALGGTALGLTGNIDLSDGRRTLSLTSSLTQDLARLSRVPERFKGSGTTAVDATVFSPDFAHYRVRSTVKGENVTARLSRVGVEVDTLNGEVPITASLERGESGLVLARSDNRSPYSMLRFADQHPLLTRSGFLSIGRLTTPLFSIAPLVGNLEIEQNVISLRQFEMGVRGGRITGQCGLVWDGPKSTAEVHVRANGVQSSHGEPFDGNIAVVISAADRTIDGRAEIIRIGPRHLLDLLDLQDPLHLDAAMNRIRTALKFGYPDTLRLIFDHGFASAHLELGGLARIVSIGELRGIPMGPIVDKMLAPVLSGPDTKETP